MRTDDDSEEEEPSPTTKEPPNKKAKKQPRKRKSKKTRRVSKARPGHGEVEMIRGQRMFRANEDSAWGENEFHTTSLMSSY